MQGTGKAQKGDAVVCVEGDRGVGAREGDHHLGEVMEAIGADVDPVVIALAEVADVVVPVAGREGESIGAGLHGTAIGGG